jgi:hypothetical protein
MVANDRQLSDAVRPPKVGFVVRLLIYASTTVWRGEMQLAEPVRSRLVELERFGWFIREATPRNFVIWRSEIYHSGVSGIVVLPSTNVGLNSDERSAITIDLLDAAGAIQSTSELVDSMDDAFHLDSFFQSGMAKIQQALAHGTGIKTGNTVWIPRFESTARGIRKHDRK